MKKLTVSQLKKKADKVFSLYIRTRDSLNGIAECITCGARKPIAEMQNGHFISRRVNSLRYDELNCNAQCYSCNVMRYGEQYAYAKALDMKYGDGTAQKLHDRRFETHKFTVQELLNIIEEYRG
jgi:hypothetical protein